MKYQTFLLEQSLTLVSFAKETTLAVKGLSIMHTPSKSTLAIKVCLLAVAFSCDRTNPLASSVCEVFSFTHNRQQQSWW